ncbi:TonB-dependent receptor [Marinobacter salarius]|uniref:TonB-dependent receptor n=1 Tax=Marinobacter salarius TaxID=1420917 RepID=UPI0032EE7E14
MQSTDSDISWMVGLNYFLDEGRTELQQGIFGLIVPVTDNDYKNEGYAGFAQVSYPLTDSLDLTGGVRYNTEETSMKTKFPEEVPSQQNQHNKAVYDVTLSWNLENTMYYGSVRTGFKSGNLNSVNPLDDGVDPEELTAYEIGFKSELLDSRVRLNGAAFYYDFSNAHINAFDPEAGGVTIILDDAELEYSGIELDLLALVKERLELTSSLLILDGEHITDAESSGAAFVPLKGNTPQQAADFTGNIGLKYSFDALDGEWSFDGIGSYSSGFWLDSENTVGTGGNSDDDFFVLNLSATYRHSSGVYGRVFVNNATDEEYYVTGLVQATIAQFGGAAQDRQYGLTVGYNF